MNTFKNYIGGQQQPPAGDHWLDVFEPATGAAYARLADSGEADLAAAVAAAEDAFPNWSALPAAERAHWLNRLADAVEAQHDALVRAESIDNGKPLALAARVDIPRAAANLRFYAGAATQFASESHAMGLGGKGGAINYTLRQPHGVVGCISPWNLPLYLFTWKIAPALAAGNCVVAKPSEVTPATAALFGQICEDVGLPPGVLNIVHGRGAGIGQALVEHPAIGAISFTGGTATGANIARTAAPMFKKLSLELGGKNPTLIFADCDFDAALDGAVKAAFTNQGEICLCGSRILVEDSLYERFRDAFVEHARALKVGDPLESDVDLGAVVSEPHMNKILAAIQTAGEEGGRILTGGNRKRIDGRCIDGWFIEPTVIEGLGPDCRTNQDEIFGPVVTLAPFSSEDEAVACANGVRYGLAASVWSRDVSRCHRIADKLEAGLIWINCWMLRDLRVPMGGMKQSGAGREGGFEAMRFFTEPKNVCIQYDR
ncbi:MAG TPA: aldehyde dehydrogenase [Gammaproteobacteria bacterium]|nr:aldehyde dehydrogenase [Gammaproteobacteria bacterium]HET7370984.1 aldehyde dehydrogenase [Gammaproteobacteria bacterium]